jgi:hypothetical protein
VELSSTYRKLGFTALVLPSNGAEGKLSTAACAEKEGNKHVDNSANTTLKRCSLSFINVVLIMMLHLSLLMRNKLGLASFFVLFNIQFNIQ